MGNRGRPGVASYVMTLPSRPPAGSPVQPGAYTPPVVRNYCTSAPLADQLTQAYDAHPTQHWTRAL